MFLKPIPVGDEHQLCQHQCLHTELHKTHHSEGRVEKSDPRSALRPGHSVWTDLAAMAVVLSVLPRRKDDFPSWDQLDPQFHHGSLFSFFPRSFLLEVIATCSLLYVPLTGKDHTSPLRSVGKSLGQAERECVLKTVPLDVWKAKTQLYSYHKHTFSKSYLPPTCIWREMPYLWSGRSYLTERFYFLTCRSRNGQQWLEI